MEKVQKKKRKIIQRNTFKRAKAVSIFWFFSRNWWFSSVRDSIYRSFSWQLSFSRLDIPGIKYQDESYSNFIYAGKHIVEHTSGIPSSSSKLHDLRGCFSAFFSLCGLVHYAEWIYIYLYIIRMQSINFLSINLGLYSRLKVTNLWPWYGMREHCYLSPWRRKHVEVAGVSFLAPDNVIHVNLYSILGVIL